MPVICGDLFGERYPSAGALQRATDYVVYIRVRSNTGINRDGRAIAEINATTLLDAPIR